VVKEKEGCVCVYVCIRLCGLKCEQKRVSVRFEKGTEVKYQN